ncbi:molybdate ABC transporter substrate-binding protein [Stenotrophomonas acidaminiphila]|uniref:molybdate ABC transporter substrate-binding protein n=1 Tax=Stenotrophomonas acidaminiphila TaxID=128780 RepID=UPI003BEF5B1B
MNKSWILLLLLHVLPVSAAELTVSAASSLTEGFREIAGAYAARHPDARVDLNFAASGVLLQQVARGAPVDVLAFADQATMDQAARRGLVDPSTRQVFARNALWVVVPPRAASPPASLAALAGPAVTRVTLGNPDSVPAGRYARQALQQAGLWPSLRPRLILAQNVRQSLDYVARGEVDAGFVYATDALAMPGRVRRAFEVPLPGGIHYPLAMVKGSRNADEARRFIAFVRSPAGQAILRRHGFGSP